MGRGQAPQTSCGPGWPPPHHQGGALTCSLPPGNVVGKEPPLAEGTFFDVSMEVPNGNSVAEK